MLRIDKVQLLNGVTVYGDDELANKFYLLPEQPRYRLDDNGFPVFRFLKCRNPMDRLDGKRKGGGFVFFDVEFVVPEDKLAPVKQGLQAQVDQFFSSIGQQTQEVIFGTITYTQAKASINLQSLTGELVERVVNPGKPSMFGKNVTAFSVEFSDLGATLFEQALQGKGGVVQVVYDLNFTAGLPDLTATVWFNASNFMHFHQEIDTDWNFWAEDSRYEKVSEFFQKNDIGGVILDFRFTLPDAEQDRKVKDKIRDWADRTLQDGVQRMVVGEIDPVSAEDRKLPEGIEDVTRDITVTKVASFRRDYKEKQAITWFVAPQGTLPNITSLSGKDGKPVKWEDYSAVVDLDDPFFKTLNVLVQVNADFKRLPIFSVDVHLDYNQGNTHTVNDFTFKSSDDVGHFASFIEKNLYKYKYNYEVNYQGASETFKSKDIETDEKILTINVDDLGVLLVDVLPGDINFSQVSQAQVTLQYEDQTHGVSLIEDSFTLDKDHKEHTFEKLILQPRRNPVQYRVKYFMQDGREFQVDWKLSRSSQIFVNDPFSATRTVGVRASGNLETKVDTIFVDLKYDDPTNHYAQTRSVALSKANPFFDWSFPVIDEDSGVVTYAAIVKFKDGHEEEIAATQAAKATFTVGPKIAGFVKVDVIPDLLDFDQVKLAKVSLHYADPTHGIDESRDFIFKKGAATAQNWTIEIEDANLKNYEWQATFFMADGSKRDTVLKTSNEPSVVLEVPAAATA
jgi:hypothetical protein